jgi:radical SAM superfamily enzyme YgiQ (UPF0313 family)
MKKKRFAGIVINETLQNADRTTYGTEPLGLEYVLAIARKEGWEVKLFDSCRYQSLADLQKDIEEFSPDVAGFSVFDNSRNSSLALAEKIKSSGSTILFGGYHPSANPEIALKPQVDYVITGEAEEALPTLLENLDSKEALSSVKNLAYADEDGNLNLDRRIGRVNKPKGLRPIRDEFYLRQKEATLNYPAPSEQKGIAHILMTRGCTYSCSFCSSSGIYGREVIKRDIDESMAEIEELVERDVNFIIIDDLNLTLNKKFVEDFCQGVEERGLEGKAYFEVFGNIATTTPEMLEKLYKAGVRRIGYGIESLDPEVQKDIGKKVNVPHLKSLLEKGEELGILTSGFYQVGHPSETEESVRHYVGQLIEKELFIPRIRLVISTPTSGSRWHNKIKENAPEWPSENDWDRFDTQHLVFEHPNFSETHLLDLRDELQEGYYQSEFYKKKLESFIERHPQLKKSFVESGWSI